MAMLVVCSIAFAQNPDAVVSGNQQVYWGWFDSSMHGGNPGLHNYNNIITGVAEVKNFGFDQLNQGDVSMTFLDPRAPISAQLRGTMICNLAGAQWSIVAGNKVNGNPSLFVRRGGSILVPADTFPATWALTVPSVPAASQLVAGPSNGSLVSTVGIVNDNYTITLTGTPSAAQLPGIYDLDPVVGFNAGL
jgi:hypothetical protein